MLKSPIAINNLHKFLLVEYLELSKTTVKQCTGNNTSRYKDYIDICNVIIDHHNHYKHGSREGNFYDFLSIIPTNMSVMTAGFLAGMETKMNAKNVRTSRFMLTEYAHGLVAQLEKMDPDYE